MIRSIEALCCVYFMIAPTSRYPASLLELGLEKAGDSLSFHLEPPSPQHCVQIGALVRPLKLNLNYQSG